MYLIKKKNSSFPGKMKKSSTWGMWDDCITSLISSLWLFRSNYSDGSFLPGSSLLGGSKLSTSLESSWEPSAPCLVLHGVREKKEQQAANESGILCVNLILFPIGMKIWKLSSEEFKVNSIKSWSNVPQFFLSWYDSRMAKVNHSSLFNIFYIAGLL